MEGQDTFGDNCKQRRVTDPPVPVTRGALES